MTANEIANILEAESRHRRGLIRNNATRERMERAARLVVERMESGVGAGSDDATVNELQAKAIEEEGVGSIGAVVASWILQIVFSWAIRRAIQIWRDWHSRGAGAMQWPL